MKESFTTETITLEGELGVGRGQESAQEKGKVIHQNLARCIYNNNNNIPNCCAEDKLLKAIEETFRCKFLQAEVEITGYCTKESVPEDIYRGKMDAIAFRRRHSLEVYVVDWKTSSKQILKDPQDSWWDKATYFKKPLYQCLLYREILKTHLKENNITAQVGVMLVPIPQTGRQVIPGLCRNVDEAMDKEELLNKLKEYEWFSLQRPCFHIIESSSTLFNLKKLTENRKYVEESTNVLSREKKLNEIINANSTVEDLCQEFKLLQLKVGCKRHEEEGTGNKKNKDEAKKQNFFCRKGKKK